LLRRASGVPRRVAAWTHLAALLDLITPTVLGFALGKVAAQLLSQPFLSTLALGSLVVVRLGHHRMVHSP
jgi:hypothetical protein